MYIILAASIFGTPSLSQVIRSSDFWLIFHLVGLLVVVVWIYIWFHLDDCFSVQLHVIYIATLEPTNLLFIILYLNFKLLDIMHYPATSHQQIMNELLMNRCSSYLDLVVSLSPLLAVNTILSKFKLLGSGGEIITDEGDPIDCTFPWSSNRTSTSLRVPERAVSWLQNLWTDLMRRILKCGAWFD